MTISYLITCCNEDRTLGNLLERVYSSMDSEDEIVILDDFSGNPKTQEILSEYSKKDNVKLYQHALDRNYGAHKNYGNELCKKDFIFQLDGDECPSSTLILNIKSIIEANPEIELFAVPRIIVNWPDPQGRIYKNDPKRIRWNRRLHEKLEGYIKFTALPLDYEFSLYHDKTIEVQLQTNKRYNEWFTDEENRGHTGFK